MTYKGKVDANQTGYLCLDPPAQGPPGERDREREGRRGVDDGSPDGTATDRGRQRGQQRGRTVFVQYYSTRLDAAFGSRKGVRARGRGGGRCIISCYSCFSGRSSSLEGVVLVPSYLSTAGSQIIISSSRQRSSNPSCRLQRAAAATIRDMQCLHAFWLSGSVTSNGNPDVFSRPGPRGWPPGGVFSSLSIAVLTAPEA